MADQPAFNADEGAWSGRSLVSIDGVELPVLGRGELIANKRAAGRASEGGRGSTGRCRPPGMRRSQVKLGQPLPGLDARPRVPPA